MAIRDSDDEKLRAELHEHIDGMFERVEHEPDVWWRCIAMAGRLLKESTDWTDGMIGDELRMRKLTDQPDVLSAGRHAREAPLTPEIGLLGAQITVGQIAAHTGDPYLRELSTALLQLQHGQVHPWLVPPKASARPPERASDILALRSRPFCVIEYLVASGLYPSKAAARPAVLDRLSIADETLHSWEKQQRKENPASFEMQRRFSKLNGGRAAHFRRQADGCAHSRECIAWFDEQYGLPEVSRCAQALKAARSK